MSDNGVDAVVERIAKERAARTAEYFGEEVVDWRRLADGIRSILESLQPGDPLPKGMAAVLEVDPSELSEIAADIRAGRKSPNEARFVYRLPPVPSPVALGLRLKGDKP